MTTIEDYTFYGCSGLTSVTIPNSVTSIGSYAFYNCSGLTSLIIPHSVMSIKKSAFKYCTRLKTVVIGDFVRLIAPQAFYGDKELKFIYVLAQNPPICKDIDIFYEVDKIFSTLYVPIGYKSAYAAAYVWKDFFIIETATGISDIQSDEVEVNVADGKVNISGVADGTLVEIYDMNGRCICRTKEYVITGLPRGIYVIKAGKTKKKIAL